MSIVSFTSGINQIEQERPLSEWAIEFIREHNLSRENFTHKEVFRSLPRRQKDAVRYQLRKCKEAQSSYANSPIPRPKIKVDQKNPPKQESFRIAKISLSIWISIFLLIDIVEVYVSKGTSSFMAWQAALLVEICIVSAAMSTRRELRRVAYALFVYNVFIFACMEVDQILAKATSLQANSMLLADKKDRLRSLKAQFVEHSQENSNNLRRLDAAYSRGFITSGTLAFERTSRAIQVNTNELSSKITDTEKEITNLTEARHSFFWIYGSSLLYFILRCLLQLFSIKLLGRRCT